MEYADLAPDRAAAHVGDPTTRALSPNFNEVGMAGEFAFGEFCGLWPDTSLSRNGDGGHDFTVPLMFRVDVKTFRLPRCLLVEVGKPICDIYVLAGYDDETRKAELLGWEWGATVAKAPTHDFGRGVVSHYIPADELRNMSELQRRIRK
jgi:hypothetical protein